MVKKIGGGTMSKYANQCILSSNKKLISLSITNDLNDKDTEMIVTMYPLQFSVSTLMAL